MNHVAATIGIEQMQDLSDRIAVHYQNGLFYDAHLAEHPGNHRLAPSRQQQACVLGVHVLGTAA